MVISFLQRRCHPVCRNWSSHRIFIYNRNRFGSTLYILRKEKRIPETHTWHLCGVNVFHKKVSLMIRDSFQKFVRITELGDTLWRNNVHTQLDFQFTWNMYHFRYSICCIWYAFFSLSRDSATLKIKWVLWRDICLYEAHLNL